jgi:tetratricopeptide (TPR) repeat protein
MWNIRKYCFKASRLVLSALWAASPVRSALFSSQDGNTRGPSILKRDVGVRAQGLGGAYAGIADDASALYWNPGGIQQVPRQEVQFMHADIFVDQTEDFLSYLRPHWRKGERETFGLTVSRLAQGDFDVVDEGQSAGTANPSETVVGLSYARPLFRGAWGVTGKWVRQDLFDQQGNTYALDLGYQVSLGKWGHGVSLANIGPAMSLGEVRTELPLVLRAGTAWKDVNLGRGALALAAQADLPADDQPRGRLGVEWSRPFAQTWRGALRCGYRMDGSRFTLGAGVARGNIEINYAYAMNGELGASNLFDLTFRFGHRLAEEVERERLLSVIQSELDQGRFSLAAQNLDTLETLSPRHKDLRDLRARLNQNLAETIDPALLWRQGQEAQGAKKWESAALLYRKLLIVQPDFPDGEKALKTVEKQIELSRIAVAQEAVRKARAKEISGFAKKARDATALQDWPDAVIAWKRVTQEEGPGGRFQQESADGLAQAYAAARKAEDMGQTDRAVTLYQALSAPPSYQDSAQRRARLLERKAAERNQQGLSLYEEGLRFYREGNQQKARALFEQALELAPHDRSIQKALERMNAGKGTDR